MPKCKLFCNDRNSTFLSFPDFLQDEPLANNDNGLHRPYWEKQGVGK